MSLELGQLTVGTIEADERDLRFSFFRRRIALSVLGALVVIGVLAVVLAGRAGQFSSALRSAPVSMLAVAVLLQIVALLARSEAWNVCVRAAGGTVSRRVLFRAAAVGAASWATSHARARWFKPSRPDPERPCKPGPLRSRSSIADASPQPSAGTKFPA